MASNSMNLRDATRQRLEETAGVVMFDDLRAHLNRDAVFVVTPPLSLIDCAVAIAMDEVSLVKPWIDNGAVRKPSRKERETWPEESERRWRAVVVQPYVLVQDP